MRTINLAKHWQGHKQTLPLPAQVYFLSIVHSMVHTVALGTSLQASIEPVRVLALTVFLYNLSKLFW